MRHQPITPPTVHPPETPSAAACVAPPPMGEANDLCMTLRATGASIGLALGSAAAAYGENALQGTYDRLTHGMVSRDLVALLDEIAILAPDAANAWLNAELADGRIHPVTDLGGTHPGLHLQARDWIRRIDAGWETSASMIVTGDLNFHACTHLTILATPCEVHGMLNFDGCESLASLPDGLEVTSHLFLGDTGIRTLPARLIVIGVLDMRACPDWDGIIPPDAHVGNKIYTDATPHGMTLAEWRASHP